MYKLNCKGGQSAQGHNRVIVKRGVVRSIPTRGNKIFSFLGCGVETKSGVEFRHSIQCPLECGRTLSSGAECLNTSLLLITLLQARYCMKLKKIVKLSYFPGVPTPSVLTVNR